MLELGPTALWQTLFAHAHRSSATGYKLVLGQSNIALHKTSFTVVSRPTTITC